MHFLEKNIMIRNYQAFLLLVIGGLLIFGQSLFYDFSPLDEEWMIVKNQEFLSNPNSVLKVFEKPISEQYYRPVLYLSFMLDNTISGLSPFTFHLTNVLLHILACYLLFILLQYYTTKRNQALLWSFVFLSHSAILHAVVWVPGRNDILLAIFILCALIFQNRYVETEKIKLAFLVGLFFVLALFTKENAIAILPILALNEYARNRRFMRKSVILYFILAIATIAWFMIRKSVVGQITIQQSCGEHVKLFSEALVIYLGKTIFALDHSIYPTIRNSNLFLGLPSVALFVTAVVLVWKGKSPYLILSLSIFILFLVIPLWYVSTSDSREQYGHRIYPSMIGMMILLSQLNWHDVKYFRLVVIGLCAVNILLNLIRMPQYKNYDRFIEYCLIDNPDNYLFHFRYADDKYKHGDYTAAIKHFTKAIYLQPDKPMLYNNRANAYTAVGNKELALRDFDSAIVKSKYEPMVILNRLHTLMSFQEWELAKQDLDYLMGCCRNIIDPELAMKINQAWYRQKMSDLNNLIKMQPENAIPHANKSKLLYDIGNYPDARLEMELAIKLNPNDSRYPELLKQIDAKIKVK